MIKINLGLSAILAKLEAEAIALKAAEEATIGSVGEHLVKEMVRTIDDNTESWEPLSPRTIELKGHDKILIDSSEMRDSIEWRRVDGGDITVGIHSDAPEDRNLVALAHEHGVPENNLPARPFIIPTWEREKKNAVLMFGYELKKEL